MIDPGDDQIAILPSLADLQPALQRVLRPEFDLGGLTGHICPVLLADGSAAILGQARYVRGVWAQELRRQLHERGYTLARPVFYQLDSGALLSLLQDGRAVSSVPQGGKSTLALLFEDIVRAGLQAGASDIHLNARTDTLAEVRFSIDGLYLALPAISTLARATLLDMLAVVWMDVEGGNGAVFDPLSEQQGRIVCRVDGCELLLRWASLAGDDGPSVCLRLLRRDSAARSLDALGFDAVQARLLRDACGQEGGALVVAGRVGSGKSTTVAALLGALPSTRKIITLEDPVEVRIPGALQNTVGRGLDADHDGAFDAKLKTVKRSAMNDLYLGEVRDRETGRAFMDLAGSGVSVYATVHAGSAAAIQPRLSSSFIGVPQDFLRIPGMLKLLVYQELVARPCAHCALDADALQAEDAARWRHFLHKLPAELRARLRVRRAAGCMQCQHLAPDLRGYAGRTVVAELASSHEQALHTAGWPQRLWRKVLDGEMDPRAWVQRCGDPMPMLADRADVAEVHHA